MLVSPIWAPAVDGAFLLSTRGGDFELRLGDGDRATADDANEIEFVLPPEPDLPGDTPPGGVDGSLHRTAPSERTGIALETASRLSPVPVVQVEQLGDDGRFRCLRASSRARRAA